MVQFEIVHVIQSEMNQFGCFAWAIYLKADQTNLLVL